MRRRTMLKRLLPAIAIAVLPLQLAGASEPVNIAFDRVPLVDALDQIQKASGIRLAYSQELVADAKPVTLKAENEPVDEVLRRILCPRGLEFIYTGENVAAIVPADSDMGMAKAGGRAIRSLARRARRGLVYLWCLVYLGSVVQLLDISVFMCYNIDRGRLNVSAGRKPF